MPTIGKAAAKARISIDAVRFYERAGLLKKAARTPGQGAGIFIGGNRRIAGSQCRAGAGPLCVRQSAVSPYSFIRIREKKYGHI